MPSEQDDSGTTHAELDTEELPFDGECPMCAREYVTAMTELGPDDQTGPYTKATFEPVDPVDLCIGEGWVIVHEADVEVNALSSWMIYNTIDESEKASFVSTPSVLEVKSDE